MNDRSTAKDQAGCAQAPDDNAEMHVMAQGRVML